jgi:hypothetical protein
MANTATLLGTIPGGYVNVGGGSSVKAVAVSFDTPGADLIVYNPPANKRWGLVGIFYEEAAAHSLIIKSQATTLVTLEKTTFSGLKHPIGEGFLGVGLNAGDDLVMQCVGNSITSMIVYVQEVNRLAFR